MENALSDLTAFVLKIQATGDREGAAAFEEQYPEKALKLKYIGVTVSGLCPLSFTSNPLTDKMRIITASNKLRYYSKARFFSEEELVDIITGGWNEKWR